MIDYLFTNNTRYLLVDEIDKMSPKDQTFLLNLMETGIVTETKYGKTRTKHIQIYQYLQQAMTPEGYRCHCSLDSLL